MIDGLNNAALAMPQRIFRNLYYLRWMIAKGHFKSNGSQQRHSIIISFRKAESANPKTKQTLSISYLILS